MRSALSGCCMTSLKIRNIRSMICGGWRIRKISWRRSMVLHGAMANRTKSLCCDRKRIRFRGRLSWLIWKIIWIRNGWPVSPRRIWNDWFGIARRGQFSNVERRESREFTRMKDGEVLGNQVSGQRFGDRHFSLTLSPIDSSSPRLRRDMGGEGTRVTAPAFRNEFALIRVIGVNFCNLCHLCHPWLKKKLPSNPMAAYVLSQPSPRSYVAGEGMRLMARVHLGGNGRPH